MIDREQVSKFLDAIDKADPKDQITLSIETNGKISLSLYPTDWWSGESKWDEEKRHKMLSIFTPLVGKLEKHVDGKDIGYRGENGHLSVRLNYIDRCKIVGYKTVRKSVKKEVEREPEYEVVEEEVNVPITDCDIRTGKFSESDIEVTA